MYLIILSHGRSRLWRATSTLVIQGIMIRSWFCSRPRRRLSRTTRRTDYGHPPKFRGFSRLFDSENFINRCFDTASYIGKVVLGENGRSAALLWNVFEVQNSANVDERRKCMCCFGSQDKYIIRPGAWYLYWARVMIFRLILLGSIKKKVFLCLDVGEQKYQLLPC